MTIPRLTAAIPRPGGSTKRARTIAPTRSIGRCYGSGLDAPGLGPSRLRTLSPHAVAGPLDGVVRGPLTALDAPLQLGDAPSEGTHLVRVIVVGGGTEGGQLGVAFLPQAPQFAAQSHPPLGGRGPGTGGYPRDPNAPAAR